MTTPPKIRLALTGSVTPTGLGQISLTRSDEVDLQICLKNADGTLVDISTLIDLTLEIYENSTAATQVSAPITLPSASFNTALTLSQWNLGTHQHATFNLTSAQTNIPAETRQLTVWAVIYGTLSDGGRRTFGAGTLTILNGNAGGDPPLEALPPLYPTLSQFAALYPPSVATLTTARTISLTGDVTSTSPPFNGSANVTAAATLATVNSNTGSFGGTTAIPVLTIDGKGRITAATTAAIASTAPTVQSLGDAPATIASGTTVARITAISSSQTYTLPNPVYYPAGSTLTILDATGNLSATTVATLNAGAFTINGVGTMALSTPYASPILVSNGINGWTLDIRGVTRGGTGATSPAAARTNLGAYGSGDSPSFNLLSLTGNGAASAPVQTMTGTWYTGGTATTTKPALLLEPTGTTSNTWSTLGTGIGVNAATGFAGNLVDLQLGGSSKFKIDKDGAATFPMVGGNGATIVFGGPTVSDCGAFVGQYGFRLQNANSLTWSPAKNLNTADLTLSKFAAGVLQVGTTGGNSAGSVQLATLSVLGLNTSATVYERLISRYNSGSSRYEIFTEKGSTPAAARPLAIGTDGTAVITIDALGRIIPVLPTSGSGLPLGALYVDSSGFVKAVTA